MDHCIAARNYSWLCGAHECDGFALPHHRLPIRLSLALPRCSRDHSTGLQGLVGHRRAFQAKKTPSRPTSSDQKDAIVPESNNRDLEMNFAVPFHQCAIFRLYTLLY
jgi:hypothetical protein